MVAWAGSGSAAENAPDPVASADVADNTLSATQARQLAAYRSRSTAAAVKVVRLPVERLRTADGMSLALPDAGSLRLNAVRVDQRSAGDFSWFANGSEGTGDAILVVHDGHVPRRA